MIMRVWREAIKEDPHLTEYDVGKALRNIHDIWNELFPIEQARLLKLLIQQIVVHPDRVDIRIRAEGMNSLIRDVQCIQSRKAAA
jgi:hypothetical protein